MVRLFRYGWLGILLASSGCSAKETVVQFTAFQPKTTYVYSLVEQPAGKATTTVRISAAPSDEGLIVTETALDKSDARVLGQIEYALKSSDSEVTQESGGHSLVVLHAPMRPGLPIWTNKRVISGTAGLREADETCRVSDRKTERVLGEERDAITVSCNMEVDDLKVTTTYVYANAVGLVRRRVDTSTVSGENLGTLDMSLTEIQKQ